MTLAPGAIGTLVNIGLVAHPGTSAGTSAINLMGSAWAGNQTLSTSLNGGTLVLNPAPTNGVDAIDGLIAVGAATPTPTPTPATPSSPLAATLARRSTQPWRPPAGRSPPDPGGTRPEPDRELLADLAAAVAPPTDSGQIIIPTTGGGTPQTHLRHRLTGPGRPRRPGATAVHRRRR